jgi:apolipoprotein N-acyltransferase
MKKLLFLSISSGLLLSFSWPEIGFFPLIFVAFIPLLLIEKYISDSGGRASWEVFGYSLITFFIFNIRTTYWVWNASPGGSITAFIINSLLMSLAFILSHKVKRIKAKLIKHKEFIIKAVIDPPGEAFHTQ